jgi:WD40 repeat protein
LLATNRFPLRHLDFSHDGNLLAAALVTPAGVTNLVQVWNSQTGACLAVLDHPMEAAHVAFSPDRPFLVVSECDSTFDPGHARIWDLRGVPTVVTNLPHADGVKCSVLSPSGEFLATACEDGTAKIWKLPECRAVTSPLRHGYQVTSVAFSSNSRILMTVSGTGTVMLWDTHSGAPLMAPLAPPEGRRLACAALGPSGRKIAMGTTQGDVFVWLLQSAEDSIETLTRRVQLRAGYRLDERAVKVDLDGPGLLKLWREQHPDRSQPPTNAE